MIKLQVISQADLAEISSYISRLNRSEKSHIGYCGKDQDEIEKYILEEISDVKFTESFVGAFDGSNQLVGLLGFDADIENRSAEIWGPFIDADKWDIALEMWRKMIELLPKEIDQIELFPNLKNKKVCELAKKLNFKKYSNETILIFKRSDSDKLIGDYIEELTANYKEHFKELHDKEFPGGYYNGQQIINRLNEHRKVFMIVNHDILQGYVYVEAEPEFGEASIEFFAVEPSERGKGVGKQLLADALKWIFTFENIEAITLCVNSARTNAINLYKKVGFQHLHDMCSFTKRI